MRPHPAAQAISLFFGSKHAPYPPNPVRLLPDFA